MSTPEEMLRTYLADRDEACPGCAYNLRALPGTRCPECNQELVLRVGLAEPSLGSYLAALSGPLAGAGASAIFVGIILYMSLRYGAPRGPQAWTIFGIPTVAFAVHAVVLTYLFSRQARIWFRSRSLGVKSTWIALGWLLPLGFVVWFVNSVR